MGYTTSQHHPASSNKIAMKASLSSIGINLILSVFKLIAGIVGKSDAMISDAIHSASDVFSTIIVIIGITASNKKSDKEHPYGHERLECAASILLAACLFVTGASIGVKGIQKIIETKTTEYVAPGFITILAACLSIIVKEWMYWYTKNTARKLNSGAMMADAWHHRSDSYSSIGTLIAIVGARQGFPILDSAASVAICIFICIAAVDIFKDAIDKMIDKACDDNKVAAMRKLVLRQPGVEKIDVMRTRMFAAKVYVDIEISADERLSLKDSHEIAERIHLAIEKEFPEVKHCMVHVNPFPTNK